MQVFLRQRLSNSDVRIHVLELIAKDNGSPPLSSRATLRIDVRASALDPQWPSGRSGSRSQNENGPIVGLEGSREGRGAGNGGSNEKEGLVLLAVLGALVALMSLLIAAVLFVLCRSRKLPVNARESRYQQKQKPDATGSTRRIDELFAQSLL